MSLSPRAAAAPLRRLGSRPDLGPGSTMSRRGLLGAGVLAGVLAASGVPVAARTRGGTLRLALAGPLPPEAPWRASPVATLLLAETLTEIGPSGELLPGLATGWETDATARDWRLRLTREARFDGGAPVVPEDVAASLRAAGVTAEMRAEGPFALRLRLASGDPDLPFRLADPRLAVWRDGLAGGAGSGLHALDAEASSPGRLLVRRFTHRRDGEAGHFDAVELVALPNPEDRLAALLAGQVDAAGAGGESEGEVGGLLAAAPEAGREELWATLAGLAGGPGGAAPTLHLPSLAHGPVSGLAPLDGFRLPARWWFAA